MTFSELIDRFVSDNAVLIDAVEQLQARFEGSHGLGYALRKPIEDELALAWLIQWTKWKAQRNNVGPKLTRIGKPQLGPSDGSADKL